MNITNVLFSPNGRIAAQNYWIGVLIIIAANVIAGFIPFLGMLISLALIYVGVCVYGKRLHDIGKTAWIHGLVWAVTLVIGIVGMFMVGGSVFAMLANSNGEADVGAILAASGGMFGIFAINALIWIGYTIWLGVAKGDAGDNRFGPPESAAAATPPPAPAASEPTVTPAQTPPPDNTPPPSS